MILAPSGESRRPLFPQRCLGCERSWEPLPAVESGAMEGAQRVRQRLERGPGVAVHGRPHPTGVAARSASLWQVPGGGGGSCGEGYAQLGIPEPPSVLYSPLQWLQEGGGASSAPGTPLASSDRCQERLAGGADQASLKHASISSSCRSSLAASLAASSSLWLCEHQSWSLPWVCFRHLPLPAPGTLTSSPLLPLFHFSLPSPPFFST